MRCSSALILESVRSNRCSARESFFFQAVPEDFDNSKTVENKACTFSLDSPGPACVALGQLLNQSTDFSFYLEFLEISSPQPIQCIAESSMGLPDLL